MKKSVSLLSDWLAYIFHENPARGAVDGDEQVTALGLIGNLQQVPDIHV
jgi:hypothetical protein